MSATNWRLRRDILAYLTSYRRRRGYSPTIREIGARFGLSVSNTWHHVDALKRGGFVTIAPGVARGIRILIPLVTIRRKGATR